MHSGRIKNSERHQRILRVFMAADHPASGEEISALVQSEIGKIPQAVSTTIGEMRSTENIREGYIVSYACIWRVCKGDEQPGPRPKRDGGFLFLIHPSQALPWHDGRPRYWLQAAPDWSPRWTIDNQGQLIFTSGPSTAQPHTQDPAPVQDEQRYCKNPACGKPIDYGHTCDKACNAAWKESIFKKPEGALF